MPPEELSSEPVESVVADDQAGRRLDAFLADRFPLYSRVRRLFFPGQPPASTVVEVSAMLPSTDILIEVEATAYVPQPR